MSGSEIRPKDNQKNVLFVEVLKFTKVITTSALLKKAGIKCDGLTKFNY
ncbi:MAG: hypothetical protein WAV89_08905 [Ignavibacteriaceae bacterium]